MPANSRWDLIQRLKGYCLFGPDIISVVSKASFNPQTSVMSSNTSDVFG
jgi:hypothetical protein